MKNKTFTLEADAEQAHLIATALHVYAHAAYPPGGSECAQVARQTLTESAGLITKLAAAGQPVELRRRQRALYKAALQWYFSEAGPGDPAQLAGLLKKFP